MRTASPELIAYLAANNTAFRADLYTVTLQSGTVFYWTSGDASITHGGHTFVSTGPIIERGTTRLTVGLEVDTLDLDLQSGGQVLIGSLSVPAAAIAGVFDGATVKLEHVIMPTWGDTSLGAIHFFEGKVAGAEPYSTGVKLRVKSALEELNIKLPKRMIQPACPYAVYDSACGVTKAPVSTTFAAGSTLSTVVVNNDYYDGWWNLAILTGTSGALANVRRSVIKSVKSDATHTNTLTLSVPMPSVPVAGTTCTLLRGCDKTLTTCKVVFLNGNRFGGFPYTPTPENRR